MKMNFWPFHKHTYKLEKWRLVHQPNHEPLRVVIRFTCSDRRKSFHYFPKEWRNAQWEEKNKDTEGYWSE